MPRRKPHCEAARSRRSGSYGVSGMAPITFDRPDNRRLPLMQGLDLRRFMLRSVADIADYERRADTERPWSLASAGR